MTAADIPLTTGQPSQGAEGQRFIGFQLYDALINWDLSKSEKRTSDELYSQFAEKTEEPGNEVAKTGDAARCEIP